MTAGNNSDVLFKVAFILAIIQGVFVKFVKIEEEVGLAMQSTVAGVVEVVDVVGRCRGEDTAIECSCSAKL